MKYLVIEIQKFDTGAIANFAWAYDNINSAEAKYHALLSVAAVSKLYVHTVILVNETGYMLKHESYDHTPEPEPEPEPEVEE
jgi:hypothetical protein